MSLGAAAMIYRFKRGQTLQQIGDAFEISRERVRQVLAKHGVTADEGGRALRSRMKNKTKTNTKSR